MTIYTDQKLVRNSRKTPGGGGGGTSVMEGDRDRAAGQGMFLPVINIGTGYQIGLMWSSPLAQGIKSA